MINYPVERQTRSVNVNQILSLAGRVTEVRGEDRSLMSLVLGIITVVADMSFQSRERWGDRNRQGFIKSMFENMSVGKFVWADVHRCVRDSRLSHNDRKYYQKWVDAGVEFLNIDSNNRINCIILFVSNQFHLGSGFVVVDRFGNDYAIPPKSYFKDLPFEVQEYFLTDVNLTIEEIKYATRVQLSRLFKNVNDGVKLNPQELRNCEVSLVANMIRDLADEFTDKFVTTKLITKNINRRGVDHFLAHMFTLYCNGWDSSASKSVMDKLYLPDSPENDKIKSFVSVFRKFVKSLGDKWHGLPSLATALDAFCIYLIMNEEGYTIKDNDGLWNRLLEVHSELYKDSEKNHTKYPWKFDKDGNVMQDATYISLLNDLGYRETKVRVSLFLSRLSFEDYTVKLDKVRSFNRNQKLVMWMQQSGKTPEGKDIPLEDLFNGKKFHGGHIIPHADGGGHEIDNGMIQTAEDNLKLGANPIVVE